MAKTPWDEHLERSGLYPCPPLYPEPDDGGANVPATEEPMNMIEKELTFGEKAVGLTFNPSGDPTVERIKRLYAEIIDICNQGRESDRSERGRLFSIAITEAQGAQMWAVKSITWRDE